MLTSTFWLWETVGVGAARVPHDSVSDNNFGDGSTLQIVGPTGFHKGLPSTGSHMDASRDVHLIERVAVLTKEMCQ